ncbi:MAG: MlaC/ttg2D family ABC transporter substrate-binding protein [Nevskiales bacterium]
MKYRMFSLLAALFLVLPFGAAAATPTPPDQVVQQTTQRISDTIDPRREEFRKDRGKLYQLVEDIILPHFDFEAISRLVLGKSWKTATPEQRTRFAAAFRNQLVRTYSNALLEYSGRQLKYLPLKLVPGARDVDYRAEVHLANGQVVLMSYSLHLVQNEWKVYDITIDAISLVTNYRGVFAGVIRKNGLDGLIKQIEARNAGQAVADAPS